MNFTKEQEMAVFLRDRDILVSAGAGAGKTRVLVSRMVEMILDKESPLSADRFLVMTFTNAAAAEMKERIVDELNERLEKTPDDGYLRRQLRMMKQADISTVHSFCNRLIRRHFNEAGVDPSFRIGEEGELFLLRQNAMEDVLEEAYGSGRESFYDLVEAYAPEKNDSAMERLVGDLYRFSRCFPDGEGWLNRMLEEAKQLEQTKTIAESRAMQLILAKVRGMVSDLEQELSEAILLMQETDGPERFYQLIYEDKQMVNALLCCYDYEEFYKCFQNIKFSSLPRAKKEEKEWEYLDDIKEIHKNTKEQVEDIHESFFLMPLSVICKENRLICPYLEELIFLVKRYGELYFLQKKEKNVYDFDDLEHIALELLVEGYGEDGAPIPSETARELTRKYKAIFVDEYQDTNLVQETILRVLCRKEENHLFVVGDVKQSIYRFRQARPDLFLSRYKSYEKAEQMTEEAGKKPEGVAIELRDNFRSEPGVLSFCNHLFRALMEMDFGGVDYTDEVALRAGGEKRPVDRNAAEVLWLVEDEEKEELEAAPSAVEGEAAMLAMKIRSLLEEGYSCKDMVILLRSGVGMAEPMAEFLTAKGIPTVCENKTGYFQAREIQLALNYLAVVDNVHQDIPMASVLLSSIGGMTEEELVRLKVQVSASMREQHRLYDLLTLYLEEGEDEDLRKKIHDFLDILLYFRKRKKEVALHELLWEIYRKTGLYYDVQLLPEGESRKENLRMLLKKAEDYEKTVFKGLFYFLRYMEKLRTYEMDMGTVSLQEEKKDVVKIMTIHKSKGLEFPVVFVSGLSKRFNLMDGNQPVLTHPEMGIGMEFVDVDERIHHPSILKKAIREQMKKEMLEEELRILYVAVTRAKKKVILTGTVTPKQLEAKKPPFLSIAKKLTARSFMDWLVFLEESLPVKKIHYHQLAQFWEQDTARPEAVGLEHWLQEEENKGDASLVESAFSWHYPHEYAVGLKRKYSVSELKKLSMLPLPQEREETGAIVEALEAEEEKEIPAPAFLREEEPELSPVSRGTMIHKIMELLPFGKIHTKKELFDVLQDLEHRHPEMEDLSMKTVYKSIEAFLFSEIGEKICAMDRRGLLRKELPFTVGLPASMVQDMGEEQEMVVVQGVIDACGEAEDGLWLLDYKTDRVREESLLLDRYEKQMVYYKVALEQILQKKVIHTYIYSFALKKFVEVR